MSGSNPEMNDRVRKEAVATFCGTIDHASLIRIFSTISELMKDKVEHLHLLFQSNGGSVADGICLYNFFKALPIQITLYNVGSIRSAGTIAYLGASRRKVSKHAAFMLHRCWMLNQSAPAHMMKALAQGLVLEDNRVERIFRGHLTLTDEQWADFDRHELILTPELALGAGLVTEISEFMPDKGVQFYSI